MAARRRVVELSIAPEEFSRLEAIAHRAGEPCGPGRASCWLIVVRSHRPRQLAPASA
jgi:hypothetical protein